MPVLLAPAATKNRTPEVQSRRFFSGRRQPAFGVVFLDRRPRGVVQERSRFSDDTALSFLVILSASGHGGGSGEIARPLPVHRDLLRRVPGPGRFERSCTASISNNHRKSTRHASPANFPLYNSEQFRNKACVLAPSFRCGGPIPNGLSQRLACGRHHLL